MFIDSSGHKVLRSSGGNVWFEYSPPVHCAPLERQTAVAAKSTNIWLLWSQGIVPQTGLHYHYYRYFRCRIIAPTANNPWRVHPDIFFARTKTLRERPLINECYAP